MFNQFLQEEGAIVTESLVQEKPKEEVGVVGAMFRQSTYIPAVVDMMSGGDKPLFMHENKVIDDGYSIANDDVQEDMAIFSPTTNEAEMLSKANNYETYNALKTSMEKDRKDYQSIAEISGWVSFPVMMGMGVLDPVGLAAGMGFGKFAQMAVVSNKAVNVSKAAATAISIGAGVSGGLASEYTLQKLNDQESSDGMYLSAAASGIFSGLITSSSLQVFGNNRTEFFDNVGSEAKVRTSVVDSSELAGITPTEYEKVLGFMSFSGVNKLSVDNNPVVRKFAFDTETPTIVKKGVVQGNDTAMDIKIRESGDGIVAATDIASISANRTDIDVDNLSYKEMLSIEAQYGLHKDNLFNQLKQAKLDDAYKSAVTELDGATATSKAKIDADYKAGVDAILAKKQKVLDEKYNELVAKDAEYNKNYKKTYTRDKVTGASKLNRKKQTPKRVKGVAALTKAEEKKLLSIKNKAQKKIDAEYKQKIKAIDKEKNKWSSEDEASLHEEVRASVKENWLNNRIDDIIDQDVKKSVKIAMDYFARTGGKLKGMKYSGMENIDTNMYVTHRYDPSLMMSDIDGANESMYKAIKSMLKDGEIDDVALRNQAVVTVRNIIDNDKLNDALDPNVKLMNEMPTMAGGTVFAGRKLRIDASYMQPYMRNNLSEVIQDYSHKTAGKIAMKTKYNIDSSASNEEFMKQFINEPKATQDRIKHLLGSIDGSVDVDPYAANLFSKSARFMTNLNYLNMGGFFGIQQTAELGSVVMVDGIRTFRQIIPAMRIAIAEASKNPEMARSLKQMRIASERVTNDRLNLFADPTLADNSGVVDNTMNKLTNGMNKFTGLALVTDIMDTMSSMSFVAKVMDVSKNGNKGHLSDLLHAGLSTDDINVLQKLDWADIDNGVVNSFNINAIKDADLRWKIRRATARNVRNTVLKGDSVNLPSFMVKIGGSNALSKLLFQFLRFPVIAHDKITIRAMSNPRIVNYTVGSATSAMVLWAIQEMKQLERDKKNTDGEIALDIASRMPQVSAFGIGSQYWDNIDRSGLAGGLGVSASRLDRGVDTLFKLKDGKSMNNYDMNYMTSFAVPYSFFGVKTLAEELGIRQ